MLGANTSSAVQKVVAELLSTEQTYVGNLLLLDGSFRRALQSSAPFLVDQVLWGIDGILASQQRFLNELQHTLSVKDSEAETGDHDEEGAKNGSDHDLVRRVADCFEGVMTEWTSVYGLYIRRFDQANHSAQRVLSINNAKVALENVQQSAEAKGMSLQSLLITPVQRLPRYVLLLGEIVKYLPEELDHDLDATHRAKKLQESIGAISSVVNERKREADEAQALQAALRRFDGKPPGLLNTRRRLLWQGFGTISVQSISSVPSSIVRPILSSSLPSAVSLGASNSQSQGGVLVFVHVLSDAFVVSTFSQCSKLGLDNYMQRNISLADVFAFGHIAHSAEFVSVDCKEASASEMKEWVGNDLDGAFPESFLACSISIPLIRVPLMNFQAPKSNVTSDPKDSAKLPANIDYENLLLRLFIDKSNPTATVDLANQVHEYMKQHAAACSAQAQASESNSDRGLEGPVYLRKCGYIEKKGGGLRHNWNLRYFELSTNGTLSYYEKPDSSTALGVIQLERFAINRRLWQNPSTAQGAASVAASGGLPSIEFVELHSRAYFLRFQDEKTRDEWYDCIQQEVLRLQNILASDGNSVEGLDESTQPDQNLPSRDSPSSNSPVPNEDTLQARNPLSGQGLVASFGVSSSAHKSNPLLAASAQSSAGQLVKSGFLLKKGESHRSWRKRWVTLRSEGIIEYFKQPKELKALGSIRLEEYEASSFVHPKAEKRSKHDNLFELKPVSQSLSDRKYWFQASSDKDREEWISSILEVSNHLRERPDHRSGISIGANDSLSSRGDGGSHFPSSGSRAPISIAGNNAESLSSLSTLSNDWYKDLLPSWQAFVKQVGREQDNIRVMISQLKIFASISESSSKALADVAGKSKASTCDKVHEFSDEQITAETAKYSAFCLEQQNLQSLLAQELQVETSKLRAACDLHDKEFKEFSAKADAIKQKWDATASHLQSVRSHTNKLRMAVERSEAETLKASQTQDFNVGKLQKLSHKLEEAKKLAADGEGQYVKSQRDSISKMQQCLAELPKILSSAKEWRIRKLPEFQAIIGRVKRGHLDISQSSFYSVQALARDME